MGYFEVLSDGRRVYIDGDGKEHSLTETVSAATTLTDQDSGKTFILNNIGGVEIILPSVALSGWKAKFIVGNAFGSTDFTIVSATDIIQGGAIVDSVFIPADDENTISFVATADSIGDYVEIESDGTNYYVNGIGLTTGSITFTAP